MSTALIDRGEDVCMPVRHGCLSKVVRVGELPDVTAVFQFLFLTFINVKVTKVLTVYLKQVERF